MIRPPPWVRLSAELGFRDLDGFEQSPRLVDGLVELGAREAVVNDPTAGLDVSRLPLKDHGPQCDACIHVSGEVDVTDGPAVGSALRRFDLVDDLHGPDFR